MKYELEKHRVMDYLAGEDSYTTIKQSNQRDELIKIANITKLKIGKTFCEKLVINELDNNGDIIDVETIKETR